MDISGDLQRDVSHNILKMRLDGQGEQVANAVISDLRNDVEKMSETKDPNYCGSCYGGLEPESGCCNTCEEVRTAYVNRGWSFSNPDAIEQVSPSFSSSSVLHDRFFSAFSARMKVGQTS
jgi:endoplasmic reticulum-Golgi intermediate compartment protein 3